MDKLQFAKANITWIDRFTMIDVLEGTTVELGNGIKAKVKEGFIYLSLGPFNLRAYTDGELRNFVRQAKKNEDEKTIIA